MVDGLAFGVYHLNCLSHFWGAVQLLVHYYFWYWKQDATWQNLHDRLREQLRTKLGRNAQPSAAVLDSQSVKTTEKGGRAVMMVTKKSMGASAIYL